ncbi:hypothetical protein CRUP_013681 [Coryphaenoides rupestris]|nr:hypothetical protein CRUP_013681 [Coryphaenoides rupestris]
MGERPRASLTFEEVFGARRLFVLVRRRAL